jgi:hypothetical protein
MTVVLAEPPRSQREFVTQAARGVQDKLWVEAGSMASACVRLRPPDYGALASMPGTAGRALHADAS